MVVVVAVVVVVVVVVEACGNIATCTGPTYKMHLYCNELHTCECIRERLDVLNSFEFNCNYKCKFFYTNIDTVQHKCVVLCIATVPQITWLHGRGQETADPRE